MNPQTHKSKLGMQLTFVVMVILMTIEIMALFLIGYFILAGLNREPDDSFTSGMIVLVLSIASIPIAILNLLPSIIILKSDNHWKIGRFSLIVGFTILAIGLFFFSLTA